MSTVGHASMLPPPPGEDGQELSGADAFAAMHDALEAMSSPARVKLHQVTDITVVKAGRWLLVTVKYAGKDTNEVTFRIRRAWGVLVKQRLDRALRTTR